MEVHPPEHAIHSWRDFLIHMATITLGLLIAIALEQSVEAMHRRHLLHVAEANLHNELVENRATLMRDEKSMVGSKAQILDVLRATAGTKLSGSAHRAQWMWDGLQASAWETARNTNATALMNYADAQEASERYGQQAMVNAQADVYIDDVYRIALPFEAGEKAEDLTPAQVAAMHAASEQALTDLSHLQALCRGLDEEYARAK